MRVIRERVLERYTSQSFKETFYYIATLSVSLLSHIGTAEIPKKSSA